MPKSFLTPFYDNLWWWQLFLKCLKEPFQTIKCDDYRFSETHLYPISQWAVSESDDNNDKANPKTSNDEEEVREEIPSSPENWEHSIYRDNDETNEEYRELIIIPLRET